MTRSKRMQPVKQVADNREQAAVRRLGESQQRLGLQEARLEELYTYREQYARAFAEQGGHGIDAARLRDYRVFLARLNEAIRQQEALIAQARNQHRQTREAWVETRSHHQAVDKLLERFRADERRRQARREQAESDEHGLRRGGKPDPA